MNNVSNGKLTNLIKRGQKLKALQRILSIAWNLLPLVIAVAALCISYNSDQDLKQATSEIKDATEVISNDTVVLKQEIEDIETATDSISDLAENIDVITQGISDSAK